MSKKVDICDLCQSRYPEAHINAEIIAELEVWSRSLLSSAIVEREKGNDAGANQCKALQSHIKDRIATLKAKETQL